MSDHKSLIMHIAEWWETHASSSRSTKSWNKWLPSPGNILFTLLIAGLLIFTQQTWANHTPDSVRVPGPSATTVNYQGRLAAPDGTPKNGTFGMSFCHLGRGQWRQCCVGAESHTAVPVTDGLFNVGLGSQTSGGIPTTVWNGDRYLEITVGGETLTPRELIRSVPIAGMALTVPDAAIDTDQLADGSVTTEKLANSSVTSPRLNLGKGQACLTNNQTINLSSSDVDIPGLTLQFTVDQASTVLVWMDGIANLSSGSAAAVYLNLSSGGVSHTGAGTFMYSTTYWQPVKGQRIFSLGNGAYTFAARAYTEGSSASLMLQGTDPRYRTCINYVVLGQ
ncbi:MAG: hypothetical protein IPJ94_26630 [Chloroflexi bacterium]|nr:hypothetical protein [Chloroflexota bacterium]